MMNQSKNTVDSKLLYKKVNGNGRGDASNGYMVKSAQMAVI